MLWEPELNLKAKAGVTSGLGNKAPSFSGSCSYQFLFLFSFIPPLQAFLLQTVDGKHQDLKYISPETVSRVVSFSGDFWTGLLTVTSPGMGYV